MCKPIRDVPAIVIAVIHETGIKLLQRFWLRNDVLPVFRWFSHGLRYRCDNGPLTNEIGSAIRLEFSFAHEVVNRASAAPDFSRDPRYAVSRLVAIDGFFALFIGKLHARHAHSPSVLLDSQ